jgi:hypothetical protein
MVRQYRVHVDHLFVWCIILKSMNSDITTQEFQTSTDLSLGSLQFENLSLESLSFDESESILSDRFLQRNCIGDNSLHLPPVSQSVSKSILSDRFLKQKSHFVYIYRDRL